MLRIRSKSGNQVTPPLPLSWDGQQSQPDDSVTEQQMTANNMETTPPFDAAASPDSELQPVHDDALVQNRQKHSDAMTDDDSKQPEYFDNDQETTVVTEPEMPMPVTNLDEIPDRLGQLLLSMRAQAGLTTQQLADQAIATETCIQDLEQGNYGNLPADFFCLSVIERICNTYNTDPKPLLEIFRQESLAAGRSPSGFQDALLPSDQAKLSPRSPLSAFNRKKLGLDSDRSARTPHRLLGLLLGLLVASFVILLGMAIIYQIFLKQNSTAPVQEMTDTSILITPQRPPADELQIF